MNPVLDLPGESVALKQDAGHGDLGDSNTYHKERYVNKGDIAEEIEGSRPPPRRPRRDKRTPVRFYGTDMMAVQELMTYEGSIRGSEKKRAEAGQKRRGRLHRMENPLDTNFRAPGQRCHIIYGGTEAKAG